MVPSSLSVEQAQALLKPANCLAPLSSRSDYQLLRQALQLVASQSDYQIFGICAASFAEARQALDAYAAALGCAPPTELRPIEGPVYIKFNPRSGLCYADSYSGEHRGVLVSCQSAYAAGINDLYGHLPLDLFAG